MVRRFLLLALLLTAAPVSAATYYVDYTNGNDSNNGTAKATPWKLAPGMYGATGNAASTSIAAGDSIILKGCVTWPNAAFPWVPNNPETNGTQYGSGGTAGSRIYVGVDKTWWDSTVTGCDTAWNRPIFDLQGQSVDKWGWGAETVLNASRGGVSYITYDNFEIVHWYMLPGSITKNASVFNVGADYDATNITIQNMYVHDWIVPAISIGTGTVSAGSCTITNYVPAAYSPAPSASWLTLPGDGVRLQALPAGQRLPVVGNGPLVTGITGTNPYTITFTYEGGCFSASASGVTIQLGMDDGFIVYGRGNATLGDPGTIIQNNVFDGSDTAEALWNPTGDCGATSGNNNACLSSACAGKMGPQIWRNNVIRYVSNGFIGFSSEVSGNLFEYIRNSTNPTMHTNVWEDQPALGTTNLYFNNVIRHMNSVNANIPGGLFSVGVPLMIAPPSAEATAYVFNNVLYDLIPNISIQTNALSGLQGTVYVFNNTVHGGMASDLTWQTFSCTVPTCVVKNNHWITSNAAPGGTCGTGCTSANNTAQTGAQATSAGYTTAQTFALSPTSASSPTVAAGENLAAVCALLTGAAATACLSDTTYGVTYDAKAQVSAGRAAKLRPVTGVWDESAYQFLAAPSGVQKPE